MKKTSKLQKEGGGWGFMQRAVIKHIKGNDFRVYAYLITRADDYGRCFPSVALIADETDISERNVQKHLANLEDTGWIDRNYRTNTSTMYQLYYVDTSGTSGKTAKHKNPGASITDRSGMSKSDRSGVSKIDVSGVSESDVLTDHLTDQYNRPQEQSVSVSVVKEKVEPGYKISILQRSQFEKLWKQYGQDGESKVSAISAWTKYCSVGDKKLIVRIEQSLDNSGGTYMTNQMKQVHQIYEADKEEKQKQADSKAKGESPEL